MNDTTKSLLEQARTAAGGAAPVATAPNAITAAQYMDLMQQFQEMQKALAALKAAAPEAAAALAAPKEVVEKVYYTNIPNSCIEVMRGPARSERLFFHGDHLRTSDPDVQEYLDSVADAPTCPIYTKRVMADEAVEQAAQDVLAAAIATQQKLIAAGQRPS